MAEGGIRDCGGIPDPDSLVISGVIDGVKQSFIDNGVSLDVLEKLEQLWVSKLTANPNAGMSLRDITLPPAPSPVKKSGRKKKAERKAGMLHTRQKPKQCSQKSNETWQCLLCLNTQESFSINISDTGHVCSMFSHRLNNQTPRTLGHGMAA